MISPSAGLSVSFSVSSAMPIRQSTSARLNFFPGFLRNSTNSNSGVNKTVSAPIKLALETDVYITP